MPSWWGKLSSKEGTWKAKKESILDAIQRKLKNSSKDKTKSEGAKTHRSDIVSEMGSRSQVPSRSPSPSRQICRSQSFAGLYHSPAQSLPSRGSNLHTIDDADSEIISISKLERARCSSMDVPTDVDAGDIATAYCSIDSGDSMLNPSTSAMTAFGSEQVSNSGFLTGNPYPPDIASGTCCCPICSPTPSPRMTSSVPGSRMQSGTVTPLHPQAGGAAAESPKRYPDNVKQQAHRLPLPPIDVTKPYSYSTNYSVPTTPGRSPSSTENSTSPCSPWKKGQFLGRGTYGHVFLGFNSERGEMCAMKEVILYADDNRTRESARQLCQEISMLSQLQHPNIVQYYGSETVDDRIYIYLEYVAGGSIFKLLREYGQLGESAIRNYTRQILLGLAYLHAKNTVHRDIKGANILVDPYGRIKLADFGMAKHMTGQACPLSFKGSPYWMAPEVIHNSDGCNLPVDIWSLGCTVLEMATSRPPWSQYEGVAAMFKIANSKELPPIPEYLSEEGKDFVRRCLQRDPVKRPTAVQLLEHPFVKNPMSERLMTDPSEASAAVANALRSLAIRSAEKQILSLDPEATGIYPSKSSGSVHGSRDADSSRNMSCPVSPHGKHLLPSRSSHASARTSPSPISSPRTASGSSTPVTSGGGAIPYEAKGKGVIPKSQSANRNTGQQKSKSGQLGRNVQTKHAGSSRDASSSDNAIPGKNNRRVPASRLGQKNDDGRPRVSDQMEHVNSPKNVEGSRTREAWRNH